MYVVFSEHALSSLNCCFDFTNDSRKSPSSIQSGGDVVNYLKSKMDGAFELYESQQSEMAKKVETVI